MSRKELIVFGAFVAVILTIVLLFATKVIEVRIELPPAEAPKAAPAETIHISIADDGSLSVDGAPTTLATLTRDVAARSHAPSKEEQRLRIRAGETVRYETLMAVLTRLREAGWIKTGLINEDPPLPKP